jgi:hypothetical protein
VRSEAIRDKKRTLSGGLKFEKNALQGMSTKAVLNDRLCINLSVAGYKKERNHDISAKNISR